MTTERFNELLNGPLAHPLMPFTIMRLRQALAFVIAHTGEGGDKALERFCEIREGADGVKRDYEL
jgi:hypothetical protein